MADKSMDDPCVMSPEPDSHRCGSSDTDEMLSQILQGLSIATFVIDDNHVITYWNTACHRLTGRSAREMIGTRDQWKTFYPHPRPVMADLIVDCASEQLFNTHYGDKYRPSKVIDGAYEAEDFFPYLGETGKWLFFTAAPLRNRQGQIVGAIETLQDVSERKWAEKAILDSSRRYKRLLDLAPYPIAVFTPDGVVSYVNPEFTEVFGWTLEELEGRQIPYIPPELKQETKEKINHLIENRIILRYETQRLTKDGRLLDVVLRSALYTESAGDPGGILLFHRDVTREKRIARNNTAILRISMTLPEYPDLEDLLDFITGEIKGLLNTEGAFVLLLDREKQELFTPGASYDDVSTEIRLKEIRFKLDEVLAGKVIEMGKPLVVQDTAGLDTTFPVRDHKLGYQVKSLLEVPLYSGDRIIGVLGAMNKKMGSFEPMDVELLNMISSTVALSVENARFSAERQSAYLEVSRLNQIKDKIIDHLSHELKTPMSVISGSLAVLQNKLRQLPDTSWQSAMDRVWRNIRRLSEMQENVEDIIQTGNYQTQMLMHKILDQCSDELETLVEQETGSHHVAERIRKRIDEIFGSKTSIPQPLALDEWVRQRVELLAPRIRHRNLQLVVDIQPTSPVMIPADVLQKTIDGILKNAVENTPDLGRIQIRTHMKHNAACFTVRDDGVGITEEAQRKIFHGFYVTQDTMAYSTKRPLDFNAGGKGMDLLRITIFSQRFRFQIHLTSRRCRFIPRQSDECPGDISKCPYCQGPDDCYESGCTEFSVQFPLPENA